MKKPDARQKLLHELESAGAHRIWYLGDAFRIGMTVEEVFDYTKIDPWFLSQIKEIIDIEQSLSGRTLKSIDADEMHDLKARGFSDARLATLLKTTEDKKFALVAGCLKFIQPTRELIPALLNLLLQLLICTQPMSRNVKQDLLTERRLSF